MRDDAVRSVVLWLEAQGYAELGLAVWIAVGPAIPGPESLPDPMDDLIEQVRGGLREAGHEDLAATVGIVAAAVTTTSDPDLRREVIGAMEDIRRKIMRSN